MVESGVVDGGAYEAALCLGLVEEVIPLLPLLLPLLTPPPMFTPLLPPLIPPTKLPLPKFPLLVFAITGFPVLL